MVGWKINNESQRGKKNHKALTCVPVCCNRAFVFWLFDPTRVDYISPHPHLLSDKDEKPWQWEE